MSVAATHLAVFLPLQCCRRGGARLPVPGAQLLPRGGEGHDGRAGPV